jgi:hypothetical protein
MRFAKIAFLIGGWYGIIALLPQYLAEDFVGRHFPPPITHPEYYYGFIGVVVVWHLLLLLISKDPARYRPAMVLATAEKFVFGVPTVLLYLQGRVVLPILIAAVVDLLFGLLFLEAYRRTSRVQSAASTWQTA